MKSSASPGRNRRGPLVFHRDGIPVRRWRIACQATGVPTRFLHDCRRTAARNLIRASVPERVAMLLTGHKSRAIFDRYNIIHEQELLEAGDQLVEYLAQQERRGSRPSPPYGPVHDRGTRGAMWRADTADHRHRLARPHVHAGRLGATRWRRATPASGATRAHRLSRHPWLVPLR